MPQFEEQFRDDVIIRRLCKVRFKDASSRHKRLFHRQINSDVPMPALPEMLDLFPPRRQWNRFRNRIRRKNSDEDQNLTALLRATINLRTEFPNAPWVQRLNERIQSIRQRALEQATFAFNPPTIRAEEKSPGSNEFRAIAKFLVDDQVIEGITASYFRHTFDRLFTDSSLAFRCARDGSPPPTHHDAVTLIENYRKRHLRTGLYVAECDIKGFFDCVSHEVAANALTNLVDEAVEQNPGFVVDPRALQIFQAYLGCYSFPENVTSLAEPLLTVEKGQEAHYKWPEEALREFHTDPRAARIGIPQGGALSCFIANCVLHQADLEVKRSRSRTPGPFRYLRYCDDMVILAPSQETCRIAFEVYQQSLQRLLLPAHQPMEVAAYDAEFWNGKSRHPYLWAQPRSGNTVPWLQFVGYQIRHDGTLRVKKKSVAKHKAKILQETNRLLRTLNPTRPAGYSLPIFGPGIRKTAPQIIHRFRQKLTAMSVGRRAVHHNLRQAMPQCWATGFKMVRGRRIPINAFKELDRFRERQIDRVWRRLRHLPVSAEPNTSNTRFRVPGFYGFPFSYVAQFAPTGKTGRMPTRRR